MAKFDIIPVIDLKGGRAVRAIGGNRAEYRALATPLCPDGDPVSAAEGLLGVCSAQSLYIADLDAIEGGPPQHDAIGPIASMFAGVELWVDDGFARPAALQEWPLLGIARPVLGSESLAALTPRIDARAVLSLDFRGDVFMGPPALLADSSLWPQDVIVMCLHSVGASGGPDFARLTRIMQAGGDRRVYAAGGVRDVDDVQALARIGAAGVLISSALHGGAITSADLQAFTKQQA